LTAFARACDSPQVSAVAARSYLLRVSVPLRREAAALQRDLTKAGAEVERDGNELTVVWPATEADEVERWEEYTFTELVFFLRSWARTDPRRRIDILEERVF